ncbi:hypothetical protein C5C13_00525 [Clavibacter michiganensis]|nr:hypothetical protein C5C13_00525 [Clavibacter michiganensis]
MPVVLVTMAPHRMSLVSTGCAGAGCAVACPPTTSCTGSVTAWRSSVGAEQRLGMWARGTRRTCPWFRGHQRGR